MAEAHRRRAIFKKKYRPTYVLSESELKEKREYNRKWMAASRAAKRRQLEISSKL
jgi:hypothetical protein